MTLAWRTEVFVAKKPLLVKKLHAFAYMMCVIVFNMAQFIDLLQ